MSPWVVAGALASLYQRADDHKSKPVVVDSVDQEAGKVRVQYSHFNNYFDVPFARVAATKATNSHQLVPRSIANYHVDGQHGDTIDGYFKQREVKLIPPRAGGAEGRYGVCYSWRQR